VTSPGPVPSLAAAVSAPTGVALAATGLALASTEVALATDGPDAGGADGDAATGVGGFGRWEAARFWTTTRVGRSTHNTRASNKLAAAANQAP